MGDQCSIDDRKNGVTVIGATLADLADLIDPGRLERGFGKGWDGFVGQGGSPGKTGVT
jgi:hypothetical protein